MADFDAPSSIAPTRAPYTITCLGCLAIGRYSDIHASGWQLAKHRPFAYVCPDCIENRYSKEKT